MLPAIIISLCTVGGWIVKATIAFLTMMLCWVAVAVVVKFVVLYNQAAKGTTAGRLGHNVNRILLLVCLLCFAQYTP